MCKVVGYKGEFVWAGHSNTVVSVHVPGDATPLCSLWEVYYNVLVSVGASLLVCYPELRGICYSGVLSILAIKEDWPVHSHAKKGTLLFGDPGPHFRMKSPGTLFTCFP